jgi:methylated-DNA-[protein]-cysteine S-methyltransferase
LGFGQGQRQHGLKSQDRLLKVHWGFFRAVGGWSSAAWTVQGLSALVLPRQTQALALRGLHEYLPPLPVSFWKAPPQAVPANIQTQTRLALRGKPIRFTDFDLFFLTPFQQKVLAATCQIPWGQFRTYGWVARKAGSPRGFRAAGQALNRNPIPLLIPCHRVIAGGNQLGGYGGGLEWKIKLLKNEGIRVNQGLVS